MRREHWHVGYGVTALILTYCAHWLDTSYAGKVAPAIASSFGQPLSAMTYVFSGSRLGMALGAIFGGWAGDRWGRKPVLCFCLGLASMLALVTPAAGSFWVFVLLRTLSGMLLGGAAPCVLALVATITPERWRSVAVTATLAGVSLGSALGSLMVYFMSDPGEWLLSFPICGVALAATLLLVAWWVPHGEVPDASQSSLFFTGLLGPMRATTWVLGAGFVLTMGLNTVMVSWQPSYFNALAGVSIQRFAGVAMMTAPAGILGMLITGLLAPRMPQKLLLVLCFGGHSLALASLGLLDFASSGFVIALAGTAMGQAACQAFLNLAVISRYPAALRGTALGGAAALGRISGVVSPAIGALGLGLNVSVNTLFLLFAAIPIVVAMLVWLLDIPKLPATRL